MNPSGTKTSWAIGALLCLGSFAAFWPVRENGFVGFDDPRYITANEQVREGLSTEGIAWAFATTHAYNWHPLTWISHLVDVELFGLDAGAHHLVSVGIHALNALLLFLLLRSLTAALWSSALVAFLFALHPLRVESVAWASERKDVLGGLLWLVTIALYAAYARRPSVARYTAVVVAFAAGLLAKPMLVTLPFVLLLLDFWPLGRFRPAAIGSDGARTMVTSTTSRGKRSRETSGKRWRAADQSVGTRNRAATATISCTEAPLRRLLAEKAPLLVLAAAASAMTLRAQQGIVQSVDTFPLESRLANAVLSCARYLGKMVWPVDLAVFYPYRERSFASLEVGGALALLAVLTALAVARWRRGYPIVGWLWFLGSLVPVLGLVQVGIQSMADRYTYLPGIGVLIFGVWFLADAAERWRLFAAPAARAAAAVAAMGVIAALGLLTWRQTHTWRDDEALFRHAALVTDDNYWASYNLGFSLLQTGRAGEAVPWFEEAVRIEPTLEAQSNLGRSLERSGRVEEAVKAFRRAAEIAPEDIVAARDLTRVLVTNGHPRDAALLAERAAARWPEDPELHYTLGLAHLFLDDPASALEPLARSIELNPAFAAAHNALGIALARTGGAAGAIDHFERALEIEPEYHEARENLARMRGTPARALQ